MSQHTARQIKPVQAYVDTLRPLLGLSHFDIRVDREHCTPVPKAWAVVQRPINKQEATIWLGDNFFTERSLHGIREDMIHELLHVVFEPVDWVVGNVGPHLAPPAKALLGETMDDVIEQLVDQLTRVLAPLMPLPKGIIR